MMTSKPTSKLNSILRSALLATLALTPLTASLHAQTAERVQVNVPFAFQNGSQVLPAGTYTLTMQSNQILLINGVDTGGLAISRKEDTGRTSEQGKVIFHRYGEKYFLSEVWRGGEAIHTVCTKSTAEIKAAKMEKQSELAATRIAPTNVELALLNPSR